MLLAAGAKGPLEHVLGPRQRGLGVAPRQPPGRADEVPAGDRVVDRQHGRQRFHLEPDRGPGRAEGRATLAGQHDDRLADVMALVCGQQLLVVEDRAEVVVTRHVGRGEHGRDSLDLRGGRNVESDDPRMGQRAADELDQELVAKGRKIVEIHRLARDVSLGRLVGNRPGATSRLDASGPRAPAEIGTGLAVRPAAPLRPFRDRT